MTRTKAARKASRISHLETILQVRRSELVRELQDKLRAARSDGTTHRDVLDDAEDSEIDMQEDIGFALLQMKMQTVAQLDTALGRLEKGDYGNCIECRGEIAEARLQALPFAVRCRNCEQRREAADERERYTRQRRGATALLDVDLGS